MAIDLVLVYCKEVPLSLYKVFSVSCDVLYNIFKAVLMLIKFGGSMETGQHTLWENVCRRGKHTVFVLHVVFIELFFKEILERFSCFKFCSTNSNSLFIANMEENDILM